jgi:hypothetical protein
MFLVLFVEKVLRVERCTTVLLMQQFDALQAGNTWLDRVSAPCARRMATRRFTGLTGRPRRLSRSSKRMASSEVAS